MDRVGDRVDPATRQVLNPYFDTTAFQSLPTQYTISPEVAYFGELRSPSSKTLDMSNKATFGVIQNAGGTRKVQLSFRAVF